MDEEFDVSVPYKGEEHIFKAILHVYAHTHKFEVNVNGQVILFEPDEERNYRATLQYDDIGSDRKFDIELLEAIAKTIEEIVK